MVRILLIDNYDSFTYNLAQYLGELGAELAIHRNDALTVEGGVLELHQGPLFPQRLPGLAGGGLSH